MWSLYMCYCHQISTNIREQIEKKDILWDNGVGHRLKPSLLQKRISITKTGITIKSHVQNKKLQIKTHHLHKEVLNLQKLIKSN